LVTIRSTDIRSPDTADHSEVSLRTVSPGRMTARSRSLSSCWVPRAREPKATIFTGSAAAMRRSRAVQTFSSVTVQERSPVCGLAAVMVRFRGQYSIGLWDLKAGVKASNMG